MIEYNNKPYHSVDLDPANKINKDDFELFLAKNKVNF